MKKTEILAENFRRAIGLRESFSQAHNNYGVFLFKRGDYQGAARHFETASGDLGYALRAAAFEGLGRSQMKLFRRHYETIFISTLIHLTRKKHYAFHERIFSWGISCIVYIPIM